MELRLNVICILYLFTFLYTSSIVVLLFLLLLCTFTRLSTSSERGRVPPTSQDLLNFCHFCHDTSVARLVAQALNGKSLGLVLAEKRLTLPTRVYHDK